MSSFIASTAASATTLTMPTHQAGDVLIMVCLGAATVPAGWDLIESIASPINARIATKKAASSSETSGTWTSAIRLYCACYRPESGAQFIYPFTNFLKTTGTSTTATIGALTLTKTIGASTVFGGIVNNSASVGVVAGMNDRTPATFLRALFDAINQTSWTSKTSALGSSTPWATWAIELDETADLDITGTCSFNFTVAGTLTKEWPVTANVNFAFTTNTPSLIFDKPVTANVNFAFTATANIIAVMPMTASVNAVFTTAASLLLYNPMAASVAFAFTTAAAMSLNYLMTASADFVFTTTAALIGDYPIEPTSVEFSFEATGTLGFDNVWEPGSAEDPWVPQINMDGLWTVQSTDQWE